MRSYPDTDGSPIETEKSLADTDPIDSDPNPNPNPSTNTNPSPPFKLESSASIINSNSIPKAKQPLSLNKDDTTTNTNQTIRKLRSAAVQRKSDDADVHIENHTNHTGVSPSHMKNATPTDKTKNTNKSGGSETKDSPEKDFLKAGRERYVICSVCDVLKTS